MASTLQGGRPRDRVTGKGHGTSALGPGDTSDTGSDIVGGPGTVEGEVLGLDRGTNEDPERRGAIHTAGPDLGDSDLDSDTDSGGTGERMTAGRDTQIRENADRRADRVEKAEIEDSDTGAR